MTGHHLDLDQLADLLAGQDEDDPALTAEAEHVAGCAACRGRLAELEQASHAVTAALAAAPAPALPDDLAARWERAIAAGPATGSAAAPPSAAVPVSAPTADGFGGRVLPFSRRRQPRWTPWLAGAAAAAVLVTGGLLLAHPGRPSGSTASTNGAASATGGVGPTTALATVPTSSTGTDYTLPLLASALPGLLRADSAAAPGTGPRSGSAPLSSSVTPPPGEALAALDRLHDPAALGSCLAGLQDPKGAAPPLALDYARFGGAPALVVVLPSTHAAKVDVYVVGAGCSAADAQVRAFTRAPAP